MMEVPRDPAASRYEHVGKGLRRSDLDPDPIKQFSNWFTAAIEAGIRDVNAMSLATAGPDAKPSVRILLLKGFDQDGFVFLATTKAARESNSMPILMRRWLSIGSNWTGKFASAGKWKELRAKNRKFIFIPVRSEVSSGRGPRARARCSMLGVYWTRAWRR